MIIMIIVWYLRSQADSVWMDMDDQDDMPSADELEQ